ncbi:MAG: MFS transporter, partial [Chloroflexi bacterium]|nr:MFS transporter [Chloroflexota bacterium]
RAARTPTAGMSPSLAPTQTRELRANFLHLYADVFWYGVLAGSAIAYLAVYAARLGASGLQVGLLTAGPGMVNLLLSLPAGHWLERRPLTRSVFRSSIWHRAGYLTLIALPLALAAPAQVWGLVLITLAMSLPGTLLAIAFNAMFADVVPPEWRAHVVGRRNALLSATLVGTTLLCGWLLERVAFPLNYQLVFGVGVLGAAMSSHHLGPLRAPGRPPPRVGLVDTMRQAPGLRFLTRSGGKPMLRLDLLRGPFGSFLLAYLLFYTFQFVPVPPVPLFWVHDLKLSDGVISLANALFYLCMLLASLGLGWASARWGHYRVMVGGALLYGIYPLLTGLAQNATLILAASVAGGAVWGLASGGLLNRLMERVPEDDRPAHMALHNLALNLGILAGSMLGSALGEWVGLREVLFLGAGLRLLGAVVLWCWG